MLSGLRTLANTQSSVQTISSSYERKVGTYWVDLDVSLRHHEPQEFPCRYPERTLTWIQLHVIRAKGVEGLLEVA